MGASAGSVLLVDDEEMILKYLAEVLTLGGYECRPFQESLAALAYLAQTGSPPDVVLTDIRMPGMDGLTLLKEIQALALDVPVILISGVYELAIALEAVRAGAADYLFKPAKPAEILSLVARHVRVDHKPRPTAVHAALVGLLACYGPDREKRSACLLPLEHVAELFTAFGTRRYETMQHSMRVAAYGVMLGEACKLAPADLQHLELGALLHDLGKIAIPRNILLKQGPLDEKEWEVMRTHPRIGFQLLADKPHLREAAQIVYCHHERYDGRGYPRGLKGEEIPVGARIFSIVDAVDAITCDRPYRRSRGFEAAFEELVKASGTQFDPKLVSKFLSLPGEKLQGVRDSLHDLE